MQEIIELYKNLGETPLECIERFRVGHPKYAGVKMTYLGRLDPMAEGLLLVLAGNTKEREKYLSLDKTYEFEVLWGFETDSYDILGKLVGEGKEPQKLEQKIPGLLKKISEKKTQAYPVFSSKMFGGDFLRARDANIEAIEVPERGIRIFSLEHIHTRAATGREILEGIEARVGHVKGNFRQEEIMKIWRNALIARPNETFLISKFSADVSSGTYIRGLAQEMGELMGTKALAWSIKRTRVGEYKLAS